jgi:rubrerythrin
MIETYSRKIKQSDDIELKQQLKTLIKEESNIKRKRKEVLKKYFNK